MPTRLNKRQQREAEELMMLGGSPAPEGDEESVEIEDIKPTKPALSSGFSALIGEDSTDDDGNEGVSKPSKTKKKKKKKGTTSNTPIDAGPAVIPTLSSPSPAPKPNVEPSVSKKEKKAAKKARAKEKKGDDNDLDKALAELSVKYPELQEVASTSAETSAGRSSEELTRLLAISSQHLDADAELKRFFGSKVLAASKTASGSSGSSARRGPPGGLAQRSILTKPKNGWWPAQAREGLSLRVLTPEEVREKVERHRWNTVDEKWWAIEYSKKYKSVTMAFMRTVMSGDPEGFWNLLRLLPYHADTLLQLAEGYRYREEHSTAMDMVDRSLFAYERAFVGASSLIAGSTRLDFDAVESRPFFLALHRQVIDLQRRGCFRTAFEFGKLLFSLDPSSDPHGALFHLDYLAIKAGATQWLLDIWRLHADQARNTDNNAPYNGRVNVTALPGWAYARSLALYAEESTAKKGHEESTAALREAVLTFPTVVPLLVEKADISLPSEARAHRAFRIYTDASTFSTNSDSVLHILSHLYAQRSAPLWKASDKAAWLVKTVTAALQDLPSSASTTNPLFAKLFEKPSLAYSAYRHITVQETSYRNLLSFIPRSVTSASSFVGDPLPPPTRISSYDTDFFRGVEDPLAFRRPRNRRDEQRLLERLVPDGLLRGQLQGFFEAHPQFAERFPGGITQFLQLVAEMDEEVLDALLVGANNMEDRPGGAMPGMLPGMADEPAEWEVDFAPVAQGLPVDQDGGEGDVEDIPGALGIQSDEGEDEDEDEDEDEEAVPAMPVRILRNVLNRFWGGTANSDGESSDEERHQPPLADDDGVD